MRPIDPDGAYADATFNLRDKSGAIGIVLIQNGVVTEQYSSCSTFTSNDAAEVEAVKCAMALYPNCEVFTDCKSAERRCGATWISRKYNQEAHNLAAFAYRFKRAWSKELRAMLPDLGKAIPDPTATEKIRKKKKIRLHGTKGGRTWRGRGVV